MNTHRYDIDRDVENYNFHRDNKTDVAIQMVHSFLLESPSLKVYIIRLLMTWRSQADLIYPTLSYDTDSETGQ